eukprot:Skav219560  [mRNA]  locus=scaffold886:2956:8420:- [translate_table: standard]
MDETSTGTAEAVVGGAAIGLVQREWAKTSPVEAGPAEFDRAREPTAAQISSSKLVSPTCMTLGDLGARLRACADDVMRCKSWPMVTSGASNMNLEDTEVTGTARMDEPPPEWVALTAWALDDLADEPDSREKEDCPRSVWDQLRRFGVWHDPINLVSFKDFFASKNVGYQGEEVKVAQRIVWDAVANSMPEGVGSLPLSQFCRLGTLHYVDNFEEYLIPAADQVRVPPPKVMVEPNEWKQVCKGLLQKGVFEVWPLSDVHHINGQPLLNGLFSVGKGEYVGLLETQRLIMNLIPTNAICLGIKGDIATLPMISGFNGVLLEEGEMILTSSEDVRCFFYLFSVPKAWQRYLGFNRLVPPEMVPPPFTGKDCVLVSRVLPMGFANSVAIAQHVHRNIISWAGRGVDHGLRPQDEIRRDRPMSSSKKLHRIYLDNFDQLEVVDPVTASLIKDTPSPQILSLRKTYERWQVPRHPKKAVVRATKAEVQGALILGDVGIAVPKPQKIGQYVSLGMELLHRKTCTLKELQIVCGGLVYLSMFRRPLLSALNQVWVFMETLKAQPPVVRVELPAPVQRELLRFLCLAPLAQLNFRAPMVGQVTCSDASSTGGGFCVSKGLTEYGVAALCASVRGDVPEKDDICQVLSVGLFDGLGALRVACDLAGLPMAGHISVECDPQARRVVEAYFADTLFHDDVTTITPEMVKGWSLLFQNVGVVLIGAGPPCQGVSGLNAGRRGALRDHRSSLFQEVPRVEGLFRGAFPWAQVHVLGESVASMDDVDRGHMNQGFGSHAWRCDCYGLTLCHRPRLYWVSWELFEVEGVELLPSPVEGVQGEIRFSGQVVEEHFLEKGWKAPGDGLPTFTTPRPRDFPGRRPAGLEHCRPHERERWVNHSYRYPPYQYKDSLGLRNCKEQWRLPTADEKEGLMGFPVGYTRACMPKHTHKSVEFDDCRHRLLGNSWQVGVAACLVSQLGHTLGLCSALSVQQIIDGSRPGGGRQLASLLLHPPLGRPGKILREDGQGLAKKLAGLGSVKGEDILLQASSEQLGRTKEERARIRQSLGSLQSLTVQPRTKQRYELARQKFYQFLRDSNLQLPTKREALDGLLCDFLELLWATGEGRGLASDTVAGLQDQDPRLRGSLLGSWRLLKAWSMHEVPNRAPPFPEMVLQSMIGWALFKEEYLFALSLMVAFYGLLRTGEMYDLLRTSVAMESSQKVAVVSLGLTKGGKRTGDCVDRRLAAAVFAIGTFAPTWRLGSAVPRQRCDLGGQMSQGWKLMKLNFC